MINSCVACGWDEEVPIGEKRRGRDMIRVNGIVFRERSGEERVMIKG